MSGHNNDKKTSWTGTKVKQISQSLLTLSPQGVCMYTYLLLLSIGPGLLKVKTTGNHNVAFITNFCFPKNGNLRATFPKTDGQQGEFPKNFKEFATPNYYSKTYYRNGMCTSNKKVRESFNPNGNQISLKNSADIKERILTGVNDHEITPLIQDIYKSNKIDYLRWLAGSGGTIKEN